MKVLEVTTTTRVRDPHRPLTHSMTQNDVFKADAGYSFELHESGLAVYITGKDHTILAPIARAVVVKEPEPKGKRK